MKIMILWIGIVLEFCLNAYAAAPLQNSDVYYYFTLQKMNRFPNYVFIAYPFQENSGSGETYKILEPANRLRVRTTIPSFYVISDKQFDKTAANQNPDKYFSSDPNMIRAEFKLAPETALDELARKKSDSVTEILEVVSVSDKKLEIKVKDRIYATKQRYTPFIIFVLIAGGAIWMIIAYTKRRRRSEGKKPEIEE